MNFLFKRFSYHRGMVNLPHHSFLLFVLPILFWSAFSCMDFFCFFRVAFVGFQCLRFYQFGRFDNFEADFCTVYIFVSVYIFVLSLWNCRFLNSANMNEPFYAINPVHMRLIVYLGTGLREESKIEKAIFVSTSHLFSTPPPTCNFFCISIRNYSFCILLCIRYCELF